MPIVVCTDRIVIYRPLLILLCLFSACSGGKESTADHPEYFNTFFAATDSLERATDAFHLLDSAYAAFPAPGPFDLARKYEYKLNYYWLTHKNKVQGRIYADSILGVLKGKTDDPAYAVAYGKALLYLGDMLREEGRYGDAFSHYYEGRSFIQQAGDTCFFAEYCARLAMTYYDQGRFSEAVPYFAETFDALASCRNDPFYKFRYQQAELDNIALAYDHMGRNDSALFYYDSTLRYIDRHKKAFLQNPNHARFVSAASAVVYGNKGGLLLKLGDTAGAENLFRENILSNLHGSDEVRDAQITITKLVALQLAQKRYEAANTWLQLLRHSLDTVPNGATELLWHNLQSQYYAATGSTAAALGELRAYLNEKDSMATASNPLRAMDMQKEFGYLAREYELSLLKKKNEIKTIYLFIAVLVAVMTAIILYLIWQYWQKSKKHVAELSRLNQQILLQNEQMNESLSALEQSHLDNSKMMKILAHDLRNPVGAIITLTELICEKDLRQPGETHDLLGMMKESGEKALDLISELLHVNVTTKTQMELVQIDLVLQYCVELLRMKAKEKGQRITLQTEPATLLASREKIWRVFSNLITNAVKFSGNGTVIKVSLQKMPGVVKIAVKDEGIGIPAHMKDSIFSMATGAGRQGTGGEESFGLGLAISKQIVESHSGRIWFESEEGKGSVFYVELRVNAAG